MEQTLPFRIQTNSGDLIYSLWAVRQGCNNHNMQATYYHYLNQPGHYYEGAKHTVKDANGVEVCMNNKMFDMMKPLIESLPFIKSYEKWTGEQSVNLDRIRNMSIGMPAGLLSRWFMYAYPDLQCDTSIPVIFPEDIQFTDDEKEDTRGFRLTNVPYEELLNEAVIVNRTSRYRNPHISWHFLNRIDRQVYFVGALDEYSEFQDVVSKAKYLPVVNFKWLAKYIATCKLFIGNQSFCYALAEAMKTPRIVELCSFAPNVFPTGPNGFDFHTQDAFEYLVDRLAK